MKYLKSYKLFESVIQNPSHYIAKMGATDTDIREIFLALTDLGFELKYKMEFKDTEGRQRGQKTTREETPILRIFIKTNKTRYVGGSTKFKDLTYIEALYHSLTRFVDTYSSNLKKITYELDSRAEVTINCYFETEYDERKINISSDLLKIYMDEALEDLPEEYYVTQDEDFRNMYYYINLNNPQAVADRIIKKLKDENGEDDWGTNYEETRKMLDNTLERFSNIVRERTGEDVRYLTKKGSINWNGLYHFVDGKESYQICEVDAYVDDSREWGARYKVGFLKKREFRAEVYHRSRIRIALK